jgi:hypothetical protein
MTRPLSRQIAQAVLLGLFVATFASGCPDDEKDCTVDTSYNPVIESGAFVATIDNPLYPLIPGTIFTYVADAETVVVTVTADTKVILGVTCTVVHDVASEDGEVIENTFDWFAQDTAGNVWYFGEYTEELENGEVVDTAGSWEAGVDGAKPGIIIPAHPVVGMQYRQEYYACEAEDKGEILDLNASATVPFGAFTGCLKTRDFTPLDPSVNENKFYAPGIGLVLAANANGSGREELVSIVAPLEKR